MNNIRVVIDLNIQWPDAAINSKGDKKDSNSEIVDNK